MGKQTIKPTSDPRPQRVNGHWSFWFFEETYRENVHLIWPVTDAQRKAYITKDLKVEHADFSKESQAVYAGRVTEILDDSGASVAQVISLLNWKDDAAGISILSHECFHVTENILTSRGVKFINNVEQSNEAFAYLLQSVVYRCVRALRMTKR